LQDLTQNVASLTDANMHRERERRTHSRGIDY